MRRPTDPRLALALGATIALVVSCRNGARPVSAAGDSVALVNGVAISRAALQAEMRRSRQGARAALDDLIDFELLAAAAAGQTAQDPDVVEARARAEVQRLIERDLEPRLSKEAIPDAVLRQVYDKARSVFVHPRLVEVAMLSVYTGARMKDEPRAQALATARELDAYVRARKPDTPEAFER